MKNNNYNTVPMKMISSLIMCLLVVVGFHLYLSDIYTEKKEKDEIRKNYPYTTNDLKKIYNWKELTLWTESEKSFEKYCGGKIHEVDIIQFRKHPDCVDSVTNSKQCFYSRLLSKEITSITSNKNIVIIGELSDDNQTFSGKIYYY